jgi:voltage-gated potassium channel Kch/multidrug transporter EmrE-like cation transporter
MGADDFMPEAGAGLYLVAMPSVVVCGLGRFGLQVVESLRGCGCPVTVIADDSTSVERIERARAAGAQLVRGDFRTPAARAAANVATAAAAVLTTSSDADNLEAALEIRGEAPGVRVVMRHSQPRLSRRFEGDFGIAAALAPADLAADAFVEAALEAPANAASVRFIGRPIDIPKRPVRPEFVAIPLLLIGIYVGAIAVFRHTLNLTWIDATYFATTVVTTVGFGDINLHQAPDWVKLFGVMLMFAGVLLIAVTASLLAVFVVTGMADQLRNESRARGLRNHVVVCGLGSVGTAVARDLYDRGHRVVVIDPKAEDELHRETNPRCPVIVGDATRPVILHRAGIEHARALVACTSNDAVNLEIGLIAQSVAETRPSGQRLRLVLRCFEADLARRIHAVSDNYTLLSEAKIAAEVFVRRALGQSDG